MDRIAQHFFARPDQDSYSRSSRPKDSGSFVETLAKAFVKRAIGQEDDKRGRSRRVEGDDLANVGRFVVEMMGGKGVGEERRRSGRDGERTRDRGDDDERRKRRKHRDETEDDDDSLQAHFDTIRRERRRRRHHSQKSTPEPPRRRSSRRDNEDHSPRSSHGPRSSSALDLSGLKVELEAIAETLTNLNGRKPDHEKCEFYDRFVRKAGRLHGEVEEVLERIREVESEGERSRRRRRRRHRRE